MKKEKVSITGIIVLAVAVIVTVLAFVFSGVLFGPTSVFYKDISTNVMINTLYQKIPALIKSIQIITIAYLLILLVKLLSRKLFAKTKRGKTVSTLFASFIKYVIALFAIFLVLGAFGVDTTTLLASAGILGIVIGLGAQSLISDILAGMFIVFEGEFEVGDIVVIDNWRGTVKEIGIRTTKIIDYSGNIKIVNNSAISTIINQTRELSLAVSSISIEYGASIPHVESIIMNNLERIKEHIPEIVEGPYYKGVNALGPSSVDLLFMAKCQEEDLYGVQRALNRELKILFDENNIGIPFPQVTISELKESNISGTPNVEKVNKFVEDQREMSKQLEDEK